MDDIQEQLDRAETALGTSMGGVQGSDFQGAGTHWEFAMIKYYHDIEQGGDEWLAVRRGILTASEMLLILTPTMRTASNDKERAHLFGFSRPAHHRLHRAALHQRRHATRARR